MITGAAYKLLRDELGGVDGYSEADAYCTSHVTRHTSHVTRRTNTRSKPRAFSIGHRHRVDAYNLAPQVHKRSTAVQLPPNIQNRIRFNCAPAVAPVDGGVGL